MKLRYLAWGILLSCGSVVCAAAPASGQGMGSVVPGTADRSLSPRWHVYTFVKDGIEYVQVNDAVGRVRAGVAAAAGVHLVLPMGIDADRVSTPESPLAVGAIRGSEVIYKDALVTLSVGVGDDGQPVWTLADTAGAGRYAPADESNCKEDPNSCPINRVDTLSAPVAQRAPSDESNCKEDPNSCPINRVSPQAALMAPLDESNCKEDPNSCPINRAVPQAARVMTPQDESNCKEDPNSCPINRIEGQ